MMTMNECLLPANTGKLVYHTKRNFIAILTNEKWPSRSSHGETFIRVIKRDGTDWGASPEYLNLLKSSNLYDATILFNPWKEMIFLNPDKYNGNVFKNANNNKIGFVEKITSYVPILMDPFTHKKIQCLRQYQVFISYTDGERITININEFNYNYSIHSETGWLKIDL